MSGDPHARSEATLAARHLMQHPLTCAEHDPEAFRLIRRHAATLDRWFTQRFGDRVHLDADTARLYKSVPPVSSRPLRTGTGRPLRPIEYVMVALTLAAVASGPDVISLRDLVAAVRTAAAEGGIDLAHDASERRALVTALQWMIAHGLLVELHDHVERYGSDGDADAVLRIRADRIALIALGGLGAAGSGGELIDQARQRGTPRQQMRATLANDPVLYRSDVSPEDWAELRRRLREEAAIADEMLGLELEARAEGVAAIDPSGSLSDQRFPRGGTESHAALLLIDRLVDKRRDAAADTGRRVGDGGSDRWFTRTELVQVVTEISAPHVRRWRSEYVDRPDKLTDAVVELLVDLRLAERSIDASGGLRARLHPAAARFTSASDAFGLGADAPVADDQGSLW